MRYGAGGQRTCAARGHQDRRAKLASAIRDGPLEKQVVVDAICEEAGNIGLSEAVGVGAVHIAISQGLQQVNGAAGEPEPEPAALNVIDAGTDNWNVPPRAWLLGTTFCREFISSLLGDGGTGKTALRYLQYLSLAIGRSLTGEHVFQRGRVLVISLEDSINELRRRMLAACMHHGVAQSELTGWLFYAALGASGGKLMVTDANGQAVVGPLAASLEKTIVDKRIDLVALDPFVKTHSVEENHNSAIDGVVQILSDLAIAHSIAIDTPHHTSKGLADPGNANRGRGASAMKDAARLVYTLAPMTEEEADSLGVPKAERRSLIRLDSGKVNIAPAAHEAKWFRLVGVNLGNTTEMYPNGDNVQTVEPWSPRSIWSDLSVQDVNYILNRIELGTPDGQRFSAHPNAKTRAAWPIIIKCKPDKTEVAARMIIKEWMKSGLLVEQEYFDEKRRETMTGLVVGLKTSLVADMTHLHGPRSESVQSPCKIPARTRRWTLKGIGPCNCTHGPFPKSGVHPCIRAARLQKRHNTHDLDFSSQSKLQISARPPHNSALTKLPSPDSVRTSRFG